MESIFKRRSIRKYKDQEVSKEQIKKILEEREVARKNKEWKKSDELRNTLSKIGYTVVDKENGQYIIKNN